MPKNTLTPIILDLVPFGDEPAAQRFLLVRYGKTDFTKGADRGHFEFDEQDADAIIADFRSRGKDLVMDYEHSSVNGSAEAPAAGWIRKLEKGRDGLYAEVEWTPKAAEYLKNREYRYHSPVILFNPKRDGHPWRLHSVAVTNHPAMHSYPPLVADDSTITKGTTTMNEHIKALAAALGVKVVTLDDGTEDEKATVAAINAKITELNDNAKKASEFLGLHNAKTFDDVTGKIKGMVPAAEKAELEAKLASMNAEKAVAQALTDGKIVKAQEAWAKDYAAKNPQGFADFIAAAPKVAPGPASTVNTGKPPKTDEGETFSDADLAIAARMGVTLEDLKKNR